MNLLIDTHALIWAWASPGRLSPRAAASISDPDNSISVSAATAYEIEYKRHRDQFLRALPLDLYTAVVEQGYSWIGVSPVDAIEAARLPRLHGDPWDRVLIAQARNRGFTLMTMDNAIAAYPVSVLW
ncbi:MAG: PIN domain-containing protein [Alphaproteobacteria bacterium]|nr:PIN domain-containing protein [Alphaproteobacteria bacterium]